MHTEFYICNFRIGLQAFNLNSKMKLSYLKKKIFRSIVFTRLNKREISRGLISAIFYAKKPLGNMNFIEFYSSLNFPAKWISQNIKNTFYISRKSFFAIKPLFLWCLTRLNIIQNCQVKHKFHCPRLISVSSIVVLFHFVSLFSIHVASAVLGFCKHEQYY